MTVYIVGFYSRTFYQITEVQGNLTLQRIVTVNRSLIIENKTVATNRINITRAANIDSRRMIMSRDDVLKSPKVDSTCGNITCPTWKATKGSWQHVSSDFAIVFSAFYVEASATVVVVGARVRGVPETPKCQLWFVNGSNFAMTEEPSIVDDFPEGNNRK